MSRPNKKGIDYFPFDIDFFEDEKIEFISARFGLKGEAIAIRLLCKIYRNGYYIQWGKDEALLFAKRVGDNSQYAFVNDVVQELVKRGFFSKGIFDRFEILTSKGIQSRYFTAAQQSRRRLKLTVEEMKYLLIEIPSEYVIPTESPTNLIIAEKTEVIAEKTGVITGETRVNSEFMPQIKLKESKVKERERENNSAPALFFKNFYKSEFEKIKQEGVKRDSTTVADYFYVVDCLFNGVSYAQKKSEQKIPAAHLIEIAEQVSFDQFAIQKDRLRDAKIRNNGKGQTIRELYENLCNDSRYGKGKTSLHTYVMSIINK